MGSRYLVVNAELKREPEFADPTDEIDIAIRKFKDFARITFDRSVILYDSKDDKVCRAFMQSEPILLVKAIELARKRTKHMLFLDAESKVTGDLKSDDSELINLIVKHLSDPDTTHVGRNVDMKYFIEPYYAFELDGGGVAGAAAGIYGALSGGAIGFVTGGPPGAFLGGLLGAFGVGTGTKYLFKTRNCPNKCQYCKGAGLTGNNFRCIICNGYGYTSEKL